MLLFEVFYPKAWAIVCFPFQRTLSFISEGYLFLDSGCLQLVALAHNTIAKGARW